MHFLSHTRSWKLVPGDPDDSSGDADAGALRHYGIALAAAVGMPQHILARARAVAELLESEQAARDAEAAADADGGGGGGDGGGGGGLRDVYSLVHRLGCVAREAGVKRIIGGGGGGDLESSGDQGGSGGEMEEEEGAGGSGGAQRVEFDAAALEAVLPLLRELKAEAERLCLGG